MDIEFKKVEDLYDRLKSALNTKVVELKRNEIDYVKPEDIWNYLKEKKWKMSKDLRLYQMVDDILNLDDVLIDEYVKEEIRKKVVKPDLEEM